MDFSATIIDITPGGKIGNGLYTLFNKRTPVAFNHFHHKYHWESKYLAPVLNKCIYDTTWLKPRRKVRAVRDGANDRVRTCDHTIISRVLYQLSYACIYGAFKLPTQAPSAGKQVFTFIQLAKVFALSISNFTCSIYIPYPASGRRSIRFR